MERVPQGEGTEAVEAILESLLCAYGAPLTVDKAAEAIGGVTRGDVARAMAALQRRYESEGRGLRIAQVAGGYQLRTAPEHAEYVRRVLRQRPIRLTRPMLETLAIIAYKQSVTRAEIEAIRGVDVDSALNTLLERRLIRIVGRKEAPGRPLLYATSREFLEVFGLNDLSELPTLRELGEVNIQAAPEVDLRHERADASERSGEATVAIRLRSDASESREDSLGGAAAGSQGGEEREGETPARDALTTTDGADRTQRD
jgi:segregation and condensation protein B